MFVLIALVFFNLRNINSETIETHKNLCQASNVSNEFLPKEYSDLVFTNVQKNKFKGERYYLSLDDFNKFKNKEIGMPLIGYNGFVCKDKCQKEHGRNQFCTNHKDKKVACANYLENQLGKKCDLSAGNNYMITPLLFSRCFAVPHNSDDSLWYDTHPPVLVTQDKKIFVCVLTYDSEDKDLLNKIPTTSTPQTTITITITLTITIIAITLLVTFYIFYKKKQKERKEKTLKEPSTPHEVKTLLT